MNRYHPQFPDSGISTFSRKACMVLNDGQAWCSLTEDKGKHCYPVIFRGNELKSERIQIKTPGQCHQTHIFPGNNKEITLVWNEYNKDKWSLKCLNGIRSGKSSDKVETIHISRNLILPPSGVFLKKVLYIVWPEKSRGKIRIMIMCKKDEGWSVPEPLSSEKFDAFRPVICTCQDNIFVVWDQYDGRDYSVVCRKLPTNGIPKDFIFASLNENWMSPGIIAGKNDVFLSWLVQKNVMNNRGIIDKFIFAMVASISNNGVNILYDKNSEDKRIVADLRTGLLAADTHHNYIGLRCNPKLVFTGKNEIWCLWERLNPENKTDNLGELVGRRYLDKDKRWSNPALFHRGGRNYSMAGNCQKDQIYIGYRGKYDFKSGEKMFLFATDMHRIEKNPQITIDNSKWSHWYSTSKKQRKKITGTVKVENHHYNLYWSDTHCHSNFSSDVEGEVDELIHFARDYAQLDAVCIADNDFFPMKALTTAEWQIHQELCSLYTKKGRFVVFPGYEYTYYDKKLENLLNHRIIMYSGKGGRLLRRIDRSADTIDKLYTQLKRGKRQPLIYPHHCTYELITTQLEPLVEICSSWRVCMEEMDFTLKQLIKGNRFGFMGSSDNHRAVPGQGGVLTGVYAENLCSDSLFAAYKKRRTIVTQGFFCFMNFKINNLFIGEKGELKGAPNLHIEAKAPRKIKQLHIIRDGTVIKKFFPESRNFKQDYVDDEIVAGEHFYYVKLRLTGNAGFNISPRENSSKVFVNTGAYPHNLAKAEGVFAWTSPIWISKNSE